MHFDRRLSLISGAAGGIILLAGCGSNPTPTPAPTTAAQAACAALPALCLPAATDTPVPVATSPPDLSGPIGTNYTYTDASGNVAAITLTGVTDPAHGADIYSTPNNGFRFVAVKLSITGVSGTFTSDANSDITVIGSDSQTYSSDFNSVLGCTDFNYGTYTVTPGRTSVGCVAFQVPNGVKVA